MPKPSKYMRVRMDGRGLLPRSFDRLDFQEDSAYRGARINRIHRDGTALNWNNGRDHRRYPTLLHPLYQHLHHLLNHWRIAASFVSRAISNEHSVEVANVADILDKQNICWDLRDVATGEASYHNATTGPDHLEQFDKDRTPDGVKDNICSPSVCGCFHSVSKLFRCKDCMRSLSENKLSLLRRRRCREDAPPNSPQETPLFSGELSTGENRQTDWLATQQLSNRSLPKIRAISGSSGCAKQSSALSEVEKTNFGQKS